MHAKSLMVPWSAAFIDSRWMRDEARQARDERKLVPVRTDAAQPRRAQLGPVDRPARL